MKFSCIIWVFSLLLARSEKATDHKEVICYWQEWSQYRTGTSKFMPEQIRADLCTKVIYSFVVLDDNYEIAYNSKTVNDLRTLTFSLKPHGVKVLLAVGGWSAGSESFSKMAATRDSREVFAESALKFLLKNDLDGLDMDWEYPTQRGGRPEDKTNFILLLDDLKDILEIYGLELSTAIAAGKYTIDEAYDVAAMYEKADYVHVMTYDYTGYYSGKIGHNAPIIGRDGADGIVDTISHILERGGSLEKTVLGLPIYGRSFRAVALEDNHLDGQCSTKEAPKGFYTGEPGYFGYFEVCQLQNWTHSWDNDSRVPYMRKGLDFISYDNVRSITLKSKVAYEGMAGVMVWALDMDDFWDSCGQGVYPIMSAINDVMRPRAPVQPASPAATATVESLSIAIFVLILF